MMSIRPRRHADLSLLVRYGRPTVRLITWLIAQLTLALAALAALAVLPSLAVAGLVPSDLPAQVGQLSTVAGEVRWYDRDSERWLGTPQDPLRNWPVAAGDRLRTGIDGRAELRLGSSTLRLGPGCDLTLQRLDARGLVLWLESGTLALRLSPGRPGEADSVELLTAEGRWLSQAPGHYRLDRQADARTPATQATSWRGELVFEGRDSALTVAAGRRADVWLDAAGSTRYAWAPVERDRFADWVARDERLDDAPVSARYVPPGMTGWQDLDRHGDWVSHPEYGQVWSPRQVPVGWAPFHDGRWAWVAPWGWTWIDAAPWGFAPFHYGSWVVWQDRWCWSPGPRHERPHYAPALRAWTGGPAAGGGGVNIGININIGQRPPPPQVVIPVVLPPRMVVAPPTIIVINPSPRAWRGDPDRRDPDRREGDRRGGDRRDADRRDGDRRDADRRDSDRRGSDRRDRGGPVTAAPATTPVPMPVLPLVRPLPPVASPPLASGDRAESGRRSDRVDRSDRGEREGRGERGDRVERAESGPPRATVLPGLAAAPSQLPAPVPAAPVAGGAAPAAPGPGRRFTPPVAMPPATIPALAMPAPQAAPRQSAAPPAAAPTAPRLPGAEPNRSDASLRPERGDRGNAVR